MKNLVIIGAGTAGTTLANKLRSRLPADWQLTIVDPEPTHLYQAGLVFLPFGAQDEDKMVRPRGATLRRGLRWIQSAIRKIDTDRHRLVLDGDDGGTREIPYDLVVIASGAHIRPDETPGLMGTHWGLDIYDFYTLEGAIRLREKLAAFEGGRLVVNVVEMPIKCPVAPLEFLFLADAFFTKRGMRDEVELIFATPLDGAFTRPLASRMLGSMLEEKGIRVEAEFNTGEVDAEGRRLISYDEREVSYDLLVSVPTHMGAPFVDESGLGDELGFVPTERHTLLAKGYDDIFVLGDATNLPSSKAGSVAHFQSDVVYENILRAIRGKSLVEGFDGHANCFIESGFGKALLIDFNYDVEPLPGSYPIPHIGPMTLLRESRRNHWGKVGFRWVYWNALLPGFTLPVPTRMSMLGKRVDTPEQVAA